MGAVIDPLARRRDSFAGGDRRGMANDGRQIAVASGPHAQDAESVLLVVEGDALDKAREDVLVRS